MKHEENWLSRKTGAQMVQYFHKPSGVFWVVLVDLIFFFSPEALPSCSFHVQTQRFYCIRSVQELGYISPPRDELPGLRRPVLGKTDLIYGGERRCKKILRDSLHISLPA